MGLKPKPKLSFFLEQLLSISLLVMDNFVRIAGLPCEKIVAPHHGSMTCTGLVTNSKCSFSCNPGYSLTGSQKRICQASSRWGGNKTSCDGK